MSPIRCTQNPTMGEEWRKGWHPERIRPRQSDRPVLVVGAGPAGLEAAQALGKRGYEVTLAEKGTELGGRGRAGVPAAGARRVGTGPGLSRAAASPASERRDLLRLGARRGLRPRVRLPAGRRRHRRALAGGWRRTPPEAALGRRGRRPGPLPGRRDGRRPAAGSGGAGRRLGRRPLLHGRGDRRAARGAGLRDPLSHARLGSLHLDPQDPRTALHPGASPRKGGGDPELHRPGRDRARCGHRVMRLHRTRGGARGGRGGPRHVANARKTASLRASRRAPRIGRTPESNR